MALTIKSSPNYVNCSKTDLVYNISSSNATNPQFRYIMDVYLQGGSNKLSRITQFPDPQLEAVFDPSRIINDNLEYDTDFSLKPYTGYYLNQTPQKKAFTIKFGEEYGTSPSSSVAVYPDLVTDDLSVFPCDVDPNNGDVATYYSNNMHAIKHANTIIDNRFLAPESQQYTVGEAYFMRALCHFNLVRAYQNVPYIDKVLDMINELVDAK